MTLLTTLARRIDLRGELVEAWEPDEETCIPIRQLAAYATLWQAEPEAPREAPVVVEPRYGAVQAGVLRYLREHGEASATDIARSIALGNLTAIRSRLWAMEREGKVCRVSVGRYRIA